MVRINTSKNQNPDPSILKELADELRGKGQIKTIYEDSSTIKFGKFGLLDRLMSRIGGRNSSASNGFFAYTDIQTVIRSSGVENSDQLLANIRTRMDATHKLRGKDIAQSIDKFLATTDGEHVIAGGLVAPSATRPINLMQISPMRMMADHAIVRFATLGKAVRADPALASLAPRLGAQMDKIIKERSGAADPRGAGEIFDIYSARLPSNNVTVMADLAVEGGGFEHKFIEADDLKAMYKDALKDKSGTVVLEPFPDNVTQANSSSGLVYEFGDDHLRAMLAAVSEAIGDAKAQKNNLQVTIATDNALLFKRIKQLNTTPSGQKKPGPFQT